MAQVIIVVQDDAEKNVSVTLFAEPQVQPGQKEFTDAQRMGAIALNAINDQLTAERSTIEVPKRSTKIVDITGEAIQ